jgi:hypothetical protein
MNYIMLLRAAGHYIGCWRGSNRPDVAAGSPQLVCIRSIDPQTVNWSHYRSLLCVSSSRTAANLALRSVCVCFEVAKCDGIWPGQVAQPRKPPPDLGTQPFATIISINIH